MRITALGVVALLFVVSCGAEQKNLENQGSDYRERLLNEEIDLQTKTALKCETLGGLAIYGERRTEQFFRWEPARTSEVTWIPFKECQFPSGTVIVPSQKLEK